MEYTLIKKDDKNNFKLLVKADQIIKQSNNDFWKPEYANWMLESTPSAPFNNDLLHLLLIEKHLINEINLIKKQLKDNEYVVMLSHFPLLGCKVNPFSPVPIKPSNHY